MAVSFQTPLGTVLTYTDGSVLFVYLLSFSAATITFCFMVSVFFKKGMARTVPLHRNEFNVSLCTSSQRGCGGRRCFVRLIIHAVLVYRSKIRGIGMVGKGRVLFAIEYSYGERSSGAEHLRRNR